MSELVSIGAAERDGGRLRLYCKRRHARLKAAKPCREPSDLDIPTLIAVFGIYTTPVRALRSIDGGKR